MEKNRAIDLLKQYREEIPRLRNLPENNQEWTLWVSKAENVIKAGLEQEDLENFMSACYQNNVIHVQRPGDFGKPSPKYYQENITEKEMAIKKIIQKYEILGIEEKSSAISEPPKTPEDYEKKETSKELELILEGSPDMIIECIMNLTKKLNLQGYAYKSVPRIGGAPDYTRRDKTHSARCDIFETRESGDEQIGIIRLTLLPNERTLFKIPEPEGWDSPFGHFISFLISEFKRLGFVYFEEEKPPLGFRLPHKDK